MFVYARCGLINSAAEVSGTGYVQSETGDAVTPIGELEIGGKWRITRGNTADDNDTGPFAGTTSVHDLKSLAACLFLFTPGHFTTLIDVWCVRLACRPLFEALRKARGRGGKKRIDGYRANTTFNC